MTMDDFEEEPRGDVAQSTQGQLNLDDPEIAARWKAAEIPCQEIRYALTLGLPELAQRKLKTALHLMHSLSNTGRLVDTPLAQVEGLNQRTLNALDEELDVVTVGDLLNTNVNTIVSKPNIGDKTVTKILLMLLKHTIHATTAGEERVAQLENRKS